MRAIGTGESVSPNVAFKQVYGLYLMNGGTPEGFTGLTDDDVQLMYSAYLGTMTYLRRELVKDIIQVVQRLLGGGK